jgi:chromosome partitioning protein
MNTKIICFSNNKGGSGKSTTCANVGYSLSQMGRNVLLIDGDMQLNLTLTFFSEDKALSMAKSDRNLYCAIKNQSDLKDFIIKTDYENLDIITSSTLMSMIDLELFSKWQREFILKNILATIVSQNIYEYILIDSPPVLGTWAMNILAASDFLIIPVEASPWGLFGLANMFDFLNTVKSISPKLELLGIAVTKVDTRKNYFKQTMDTLKETNNLIFESYIRLDSNVEWSQDNSSPIAVYKKNSRSALEYYNLALEVDKYASR